MKTCRQKADVGVIISSDFSLKTVERGVLDVPNMQIQFLPTLFLFAQAR